MAIRFDATGEELARLTTPPPMYSCTLMAWVKIAALPASYGTFFSIEWAAGQYHAALVQSTGLFRLFSANGPGFANGATLAVGIWYHIAFTIAGSSAGQFLGYLNGVQNISHTAKASATATGIRFGRVNDGDDLNGTEAALKVWNRVLTAAQIRAEMGYVVPLIFTDLNTWAPCEASRAALHHDLGPYQQHLTVGGTVTSAPGPPIAWAPQRRTVWGQLAAAGTPAGPKVNSWMLAGVGR